MTVARTAAGFALRHPNAQIAKALTRCAFAAAALCTVVQGHAAEATQRVNIAYTAGAGHQVRQALGQARGRLVRELPALNALVAEVPQSALAGLAKARGVEFVEADAKRYPKTAMMPSTGQPYALGQWVPQGLRLVQADQVSDRLARNRKLCIIDSGIDGAHPDFAGLSMSGDAVPQAYPSWYTDELGHGTRVAGIIAARNNSTGTVGVLPNAQLELRVQKLSLQSSTSMWWVYSSDLVEQALACQAQGAQVINVSWGGTEPNRLEARSFDRLARAGILSVAPNDNLQKVPVYPAGYDSVLAVGAVDTQLKSPWAGTAPLPAGLRVDLVAPGQDVLTTVVRETGLLATVSQGGQWFDAGAYTYYPAVGTVTAPMATLDDNNRPLIAGKVCVVPYDYQLSTYTAYNCGANGAAAVVMVLGPGEHTVASKLHAPSPTGGWLSFNVPVVWVSYEAGQALLGRLGQPVTLNVNRSDHEVQWATVDSSLATAYVSGVAALVWSHFPQCRANEIRKSLALSARDLGNAGVDAVYGAGLVQAKAAYDRIAARGCGR